jgi:RNA polymerase sigma-70 factor, ECF subfamily
MLGLDGLIWALSFSTFSVIRDDSARTVTPEQQLLLEQASRADPAALGALYDQYSGKIYSYIYHRVGQVELAEDLTAQVFMRMLEAVSSGKSWQSSFSGWLYRIAHNLVIDHYRRRGRASFVDIDDAPPISSEAEPFDVVEARLNGERIQAALSRLTDEQAEVITLRFIEGLSIAEVAALMDKTDGAVKALQYRAVLALRRVMQP